MEPKIVFKAGFTVVGVAAEGDPGTLNYGEIWEKQYMPVDELLKPHSIDGGYYGATFCDGSKLFYLAGVAVEDLPELPPGTVAKTIPTAAFAMFECGMDEIAQTWHAAYEQWLPTSDFTANHDGMDFEFYPTANDLAEMRVEIYIPVKKK